MAPKEAKEKPKAPPPPHKNIVGLCDRLCTNSPADEAFAKMPKSMAALHLWNLVLASKKAIEEIAKASGVAALQTLLDKGEAEDKHVAMGALQARSCCWGFHAYPRRRRRCPSSSWAVAARRCAARSREQRRRRPAARSLTPARTPPSPPLSSRSLLPPAADPRGRRCAPATRRWRRSCLPARRPPSS